MSDNEDESKKQVATDSVDSLPLDWTQLGVPADEAMPLRYPRDVAEIDKEDLDICIVGTAGQKITVINPDFSEQCHPELETLVLRSHLIRQMQGLEGFTKLEVLELYDNQVEALDCLQCCGPNLRVLDMSYNVIRDLQPASICQNLQELYIANNKLKSISGLKNMTKLRKVDLGANRIRFMDPEELGGLINLEELWIGKNKIETIQGLDNLTKLRRLDVQSNRLTKVENLTTQLETLEELYLSHNGIDDEGASMATGLALKFSNLSVLDMSRNQLTSTAPFSHLPGLEDLWLSGNQVKAFDAVEPLRQAAAAGEQHLETLYLEYNPLASEFDYRKKLSEWIPSLTQIDATMIGAVSSTARTSTTTEDQLRQFQQQALARAQEETKEQGDSDANNNQ